MAPFTTLGRFDALIMAYGNFLPNLVQNLKTMFYSGYATFPMIKACTGGSSSTQPKYIC